MSILYQFTIYPLECVYHVLYLFFVSVLGNYGLALVALSVATTALLSPLMKWVSGIQADEKKVQDILAPQVRAIRQAYRGVEQHERLRRLYRRYGYHPYMALRSAVGILLQVPFLMAAYYMVSAFTPLSGQSFLAIADLSRPDQLLGSIHLLPILMTVINLLGAYTMPGFHRRDFPQAVVIAVLFLVLLYSAPAALLIFWTCNNLWSLLRNLLQKGATAHFEQMRALCRWKRRLRPVSLAPEIWLFFAFAATVGCLLPVDVYLTNNGEFFFTLASVFPYFLMTSLFLFILLVLIDYVWKRMVPRRKMWWSLFVLCVFLCVLIHGYFLIIDYGRLDGAPIHWRDSFSVGCVDTFITVDVALIIFYSFAKHTSAWLKHWRLMKSMSIAVIMVQCFALCYVSVNDTPQKLAPSYVSTNHIRELSKNDNVIVLLFDSFDTKVFQEIQQQEPEELEFLDGFTYYPDATSYFGYTNYSLPQMVTGEVYDGKEPHSVYSRDCWNHLPLFDALKDRGYDCDLYTNALYIPEGVPIDNLITEKLPVTLSDIRDFYHLVAFRGAVHPVKYLLFSGMMNLFQVEEGPWEAGERRQFSSDNGAFYNEIKKGLYTEDTPGSFRWYHLEGAHGPYIYNRDMKNIAGGSNAGTEYEQSVACLRIAREFINQMKDLGIYDNATIVICADHGEHNVIGHSPVVLVKQPQETGTLKVSPNAVSYKNFIATLLRRYLGTKSSLGTSFDEAEEKTRQFYLIDDTRQNHFIRYRIEGDAAVPEHWLMDGDIQVVSDPQEMSYRLDRTMTFLTTQHARNFCVSGWFMNWPEDVPAIDKEAQLMLYVKDYDHMRDLRMTVKMAPSNSQRKVDIYVNGEIIGQMDMTRPRKYTVSFKIPARLVSEDGCLRIVFDTISDLPEKDADMHEVRVMPDQWIFRLSSLRLSYDR